MSIRARIKDACDLMRQLVPGMSEKTDKATVFEFSARYIHFLKNFVGTHHDKVSIIKPLYNVCENSTDLLFKVRDEGPTPQGLLGQVYCTAMRLVTRLPSTNSR